MTEVQLYDNSNLPVFGVFGLSALFDTGAEVSVFNASKDMFELIFVNNFKDKTPWVINGFGGSVTGTKYTVLSIEMLGITLKNVEFVVPDKPATRYKFIIAATVLKDHIYSIDMPNRKLIIY